MEEPCVQFRFATRVTSRYVFVERKSRFDRSYLHLWPQLSGELKGSEERVHNPAWWLWARCRPDSRAAATTAIGAFPHKVAQDVTATQTHRPAEGTSCDKGTVLEQKQQ